MKFDHLRLGDAIRILLQLLWLALVRTTPRPISPLPRWKRHGWHWLAMLRHRLTGKATARIKRRMDQLHAQIEPVAGYFRQVGEEYAKHRCWGYPVTRYLAYGISLPLAFLCISISFDMFDQLTFAALLLAIALIARLVAGQEITLLLAGLSIIVSSRYFWWRASSTLSFDENIDLEWGLVLLAAEFYIWLVFLMDHFKAGWPVKRPSVESDQVPSAAVSIQMHDGLVNGIARVVFLTAPLAFLLFDAYIIYAPAIMLALYALPHMAHATIANQRMQRGNRFSFLAVVYETVLSWCVTRHITAILFNPHKETSNVTGGSAEKGNFDLNALTPFILLIGLNLIGIVAGLNRWYLNPHDEISILLLNLTWTFYNLLFLGAAITVIVKFEKTGAASLPGYDLRETLALCFMGYYYLGKLLLLCFSPFTRRISRLGMLVETYLPRSPELSSE